MNPVNANEFITGSHDKTIMIWDAVKAKMVKCLKGNDQGIWNLNYTKNGKNFVSASPDGVCKMWDARSGKEVAKYAAHKRRVSNKWRNFLSVSVFSATKPCLIVATK